MEWLESWPSWLDVASKVVAAASVVAAITPWPQDDSAVKWARKALAVLACNVGQADGMRDK